MNTQTSPQIKAQIETTLREWRTRALDIILIVVIVVSLPAMISSVGNAVRTTPVSPRVWIYPIVFLLAVGLTVFRNLDVRLRGWGLLFLGYTNAIASFTELGLAGSGRLYLIWIPITAVILVGARAGYATAVLSLLIYAAFAGFARSGMLSNWLDVTNNPVDLGFWIEAGTALAMLLVPAVVLLERFYRLGVDTLAAERETSADLAQAKARLEEYSQTLEQRVEQRTAELKQTMQEAEKARAAAEAATRAKSDFLAKMSHELRTPLNAILGFTQLMEHDPALTPDQRENVTTINRSGEYLLALINDVLDMSKIEAGRVSMQEEGFDLYRLLQDLEDLFQLRAVEKGLTLVFDCAPEVPRYVRTDVGKLRQVLTNLLGNAVKFTKQGGVTLRVRSAGERRLHFELEDTGPGIADDELVTVFDPFTQTASGEASREGTGLGLPISRQFVRLMGGDITVESELGKGSVFKFDIPVELADPSELPEAPRRRRVVGLAPGQPDYRLLVVEDNAANRQLLVKLLESTGFQVRDAITGQEALEIFERWHPHPIWMDMGMPVMDGLEATERIKGLTAGQATVIVALTASVFEEDRDLVLSKGCDDFVRKPFRTEEIFDVLAQHLGLEFVYEEEEQAQLAAQLTDGQDALTPSDLTALPGEWLVNLHQATIKAHLSQMLILIDQIREQAPAVADALADLAHRFEYKRILILIEQAQGIELQANGHAE